jgi:hypothetical protein
MIFQTVPLPNSELARLGEHAMRKTALTLLAVGLLFSAIFVCWGSATESKKPVLVLLKQYEKPVITAESPGAEGIKFGFEGGRALKIGKTYHLMTMEILGGEPRFRRTNLGYWTSQDRIHWKRVSTLMSSTGDQSGKDIRAVLAGPMPIYNEKDQRWELFYVGYRSQPETAPYPPDSERQDQYPYLFEGFDPQYRDPHLYYSYGGTIWRAISKTKGVNGIGGPYEDVGVILRLGPQSQPWEGFFGTDSFFPYRVKNKWYGLYGSCHTEKVPIRAWQVGLASAPELAGPWTREKQNPLQIENFFIENPIVTQLPDKTYLAVYNGPNPNAIGYTCSADGVHWSKGVNLVIQPQGRGHWASTVRTPLGLIPEGNNNTFTLFYTGFIGTGDAYSDPHHTRSVGFVTLKLEYK